jgi:long-subunit acyl-CoA synthetase (AMP-forming)
VGPQRDERDRACNPPSGSRSAPSDRRCPGVELRLAEDGEVELRGDCVFAGYSARRRRRARPSPTTAGSRPATSASSTTDGYLKIVDRKKELIINAAGKNMSPANIESTLKAEGPLIGSVVVIGDRRPLQRRADRARSRRRGGFDGSVEDAIAESVEKANQRLSKVEQIKRHTVLDTEWEPGGDELTPTMKIKRKPIAEKYAAEIEELYER